MTELDGLVMKPENSAAMEQGPGGAAPPPENPGEERFTEAFPRPNRAIGWYRFVLWIMPTCVVLTTGVGAALLPGELEFRYRGVIWGFWFVFNAAAIVGIGILEAKLEYPRWRGTAARLDPVEVVKFVVAQVFIVPFLGLVVVAACASVWRF